VVLGVGYLGVVALEVGGIRRGDDVVQAVELGLRLGLRVALDFGQDVVHETSEISLPAAARASSVTFAPASMRASSSRRVLTSRGRTCVRMKAPSSTACFSMSR